MGKRFIFVVAVAAVIGAMAVNANAEGLRFEGSVPYKLDTPLEVGAKVGPVTILTVTFSQAESGHVGSKIVGKLRRGEQGLQGVLKLAFEGENPTKEEWEVTFTIELLDREGKVIDRFDRSTDFQGEAKTYTTEHPILLYVLPLIHTVKLDIKGKID